jgi:hypothetical protein
MTTPADWTGGDSLFVFGSLMDRDVLGLVSGIDADNLMLTPATAYGQKQCEVVEESYPVLVADEAASCSGLLISQLTPLALQRIMFFEGEEYFLAPVSVSAHGGSVVNAWYFRDAGVYTVRGTAWDFAAWQNTHKTSFMQASSEYMALFGTMTSAEADAHWQALAEASGSDEVAA